MATTVLAQTRDRVWTPVLNGVRADAMDCIAVNLAVLADGFHGVDAHLALGTSTAWSLRFTDGLPTVETTVADHLEQARRRLGVKEAQRWSGVTGSALCDLLDSGGDAPIYVVADAYDMPWAPYHGQRHMEHSFLATAASTGGYVLLDAYHNETQWGPARPGAWRVPAKMLAEAVSGGALVLRLAANTPEPVDVTAAIRDNAACLREADIEGYVGAQRDFSDRAAAMERVTLDVWLLTRARLLHAAWLDTVAEVPAEAREAAHAHARAWTTLAAQTFVASRRVARGAPEPPAVLESLESLLRQDIEYAVALANQIAGAADSPGATTAATVGPAAPGSTAPDVIVMRDAVMDALCAIFRVEPATVTGAETLRDVPHFTSFGLVDVIERVEGALGVEVAPEDLTPENLTDLDRLCAIFARAARREPVGEHR